MKCSAALPGTRSWSRPPRGGRGLKLTVTIPSDVSDIVAPLAGGVD